MIRLFETRIAELQNRRFVIILLSLSNTYRRQKILTKVHFLRNLRTMLFPTFDSYIL